MIFGQTKCVTCDTFVTNDQCQPCGIGTFEKPLVGCTDCIDNCDICRDTITCLTCSNGFELTTDERPTCQVIDKGPVAKIVDSVSEDSNAWMVIATVLVILILVIVLIAVCVYCEIMHRKKTVPDRSDDSKTKIHDKAEIEVSNRDDDDLIKKTERSSDIKVRTKAPRKMIVSPSGYKDEIVLSTKEAELDRTRSASSFYQVD